MRPPAKSNEPLPSLLLSHCLSQEFPLQHDLGVNPKRHGPNGITGELESRDSLPPSVLHHELIRSRSSAQLLRVGSHRLVLHPKRREHLPPRRGGRKDQLRRHGGPGQGRSGNQISISRAADSSESEPWTRLKVTSTA